MTRNPSADPSEPDGSGPDLLKGDSGLLEGGGTATLTLDTILMENVPKVRHWATVRLGRLATPDVLVVINELMTNAVEHGTGSPIAVKVDATAHGLTIQVTNPAAGSPMVQSTSADDHRGRGMAIVAAIADDLDVAFDASGMVTVTARLLPAA